MVSVDGTDCRYEITDTDGRWWSYKFRKSGLRYLVAVSIKHGDIVYIEGPFPCGAYNDIKVFRWGIVGFLDENERVEADDGYIGEAPRYVKCPAKTFGENDDAKDAMCARLRLRHETVNKKLKQFGCLRNRFRHHDFAKHSSCFRAAAVITQVGIDFGEKLFDVEYTDIADNEAEYQPTDSQYEP